MTNWCIGEQISTVEDLMGVKKSTYNILFHLSIIL